MDRQNAAKNGVMGGRIYDMGKMGSKNVPVVMEHVRNE